MARIYSSRVLIDPSLLSTIGRATEDRIRMENERRRNVLSPVVKLLSNTGSEIDKYRASETEEEKQRKRYSDVAWQSSEEQMADPMYRAALDEYARTGSAAPLSQYMLGKETREANRLERERAAEEKAALERKEFELSKAENLPRFKEAIRKYNEEINKPAPDFELADQYMAEADAINKRFGFDARELDKIAESNRKTAEKRIEAAKIAQEEKELEEMGARNLKALQDAEEAARQVNVQKFLVDIDNKMANAKTADDRKAVMDEVFAAGDGENPLLKKQEVTDIITELRKQLSSQEEQKKKNKEAIQGAYASAAGKKAEKKIAESDELKILRDKKSRGIPFSSREQKRWNELGGK